jgi:hypothetical protein
MRHRLAPIRYLNLYTMGEIVSWINHEEFDWLVYSGGKRGSTTRVAAGQPIHRERGGKLRGGSMTNPPMAKATATW